MGDFNAVVSQEEHRGGAHYYYRRKALAFSEFIAANNLLDINYVGSQYTWCNNQQGLARRWARLDRCLVNPSWSNSFDACLVKHLPRFLSDHSPMLLSITPRIGNKKKIFRFDNYWLDYVGCHEAVRKAWCFTPHSNPMHAVSHLFSRTRYLLLDWKAKGLCSIDSAIEKLENSILEVEEKEGLGDGIDYSPQSLSIMYNNLSALHRQNNTKWAQRARLMWVQNDLWTDSARRPVQEIISVLPDDLPMVSYSEGEALIKEVSKKEVFDALLSLPTGKSPGPDGFNVEFYRFYWTEIGDLIFAAIRYFFEHSVMPNSWGRTYVALIPKKSNPQSPADFRPISLCNVCYKLISKILANRLKYILPNLIGKEQCGFVHGRTPFDNIITLQEVAHSIDNDNNPPRMLIKLDIAKSYDTMSWSAILVTLTKMGFPGRWVSWIHTCISKVSYALLINKTPTSWFSTSRGIRQGDPISPYLFILVAQNLTTMLNYAMNSNLIPGFDSRLIHNFNHLMYADDLILITEASRKSARNIKKCLLFYGNVTGQRINNSKSELIFPSQFNKHLANRITMIMDYKVGSFPVKYLGILISPKKLALSCFTSMVDKIEKSVTFWKKSRISPAGKTILINSSIMTSPLYYLSVYPVPKGILDRINRAARTFFWAKDSNRKGINSVSWDEITLNRTEGGLSIRNLESSKISLMAKNVLSLLNKNTVWWVSLLEVKYGAFDIWKGNIPGKCSWFYRGLWLDHSLLGNDSFTQSVIVATVWLIWKARCNKIFKEEELDCKRVSINAIRHVREYQLALSPLLKSSFVLNNFTIAESPILLIASVYNADSSSAGLGFIVSDYTSTLICSGCCGCPVISAEDAAVKEFSFALQVMLNWRWNFKIKTILSSSADIVAAILNSSRLNDWRLDQQLFFIGDLLIELGNPATHLIPGRWSKVPSSLALYGLNHHEVSLFFSGRDLPKWLMKSLRSQVRQCLNLKKLPFKSGINNNSQRILIDCKREWWESLEWDDATIPSNLRPRFRTDGSLNEWMTSGSE
ncbi:uncharacterized protein LOC120252479 [Dioscorea cayenensis subsp. rotundata]|uniref:Uncharacterized protein LOC120252479 n=1 Tax=Dioscorea cayennensis subsp. rotundata TaxID=55577 RepID=A0AB40ANM5_DIOCR|nr:uncharacterized protein LOC120252479 [Dioscorea cayenensis subsp. rotundata]